MHLINFNLNKLLWDGSILKLQIALLEFIKYCQGFLSINRNTINVKCKSAPIPAITNYMYTYYINKSNRK